MYLFGDGPHEGGHLTGDGEHHLIGILAASDELGIALAESELVSG